MKASRAKLYRALSDAGLRTQAALAERIADQEGLDSPPKDTINRVFRELPVEVQTLERVARALGVEAYSLYRSSDDIAAFGLADEATDGAGGEASSEPVDATPNAVERHAHPARWAAMGAGVAAALMAALLIVSIFSLKGTEGDARTESVLPRLDLGRPTLQVLSIEDDESGRLAEALRKQLGEHFQVASATAGVLTESLPPRTAARRLRTDVTLDGAIVRIGRLAGLRFHVLESGVRRLIWAESLPQAALPEQYEAVAERLTAAVLHGTGRPGEGAHFPPADAQDDYMAGRQYLDMPSNELNVKRAQSRLDAALRKDRRYAAAHGALCEAAGKSIG